MVAVFGGDASEVEGRESEELARVFDVAGVGLLFAIVDGGGDVLEARESGVELLGLLIVGTLSLLS